MLYLNSLIDMPYLNYRRYWRGESGWGNRAGGTSFIFLGALRIGIRGSAFTHDMCFDCSRGKSGNDDVN